MASTFWKNIPTDPLWKLAVKVIVAAMAVNAVVILAYYLSVAPYGTSFLIGLAHFTVFLFLAALLAIPTALALLFFRRYRKYSVRLLIVAVVYILLATGGLNIAFRVRRDGFIQLAQRSRPLVTAIRQFEDKYGKPPDELSQLVPEFLNEVPQTGVGAYPEYKYLALPDKKNYRDNTWVLKVDTPAGMMNWDLFLYFPNQNYPERGYGGVLERLEDWAYVHE